MSHAPLWRLPEESLHWNGTHWQVLSAPGHGAAEAVFMPIAPSGAGWRAALADDAVLPLTRVEDGRWTTVRRRGGEDGCRYLCVLRYDLPSNHPDDSFFLDAAEGSVTGAELRKVLALLQRLKPRRIATDSVSGPPDRDDAAGAVRTQFVPQAREEQERAGEPPASLAFAFASCQYPAGLLDRGVAHASYRRLAGYLRAHPWPERLLLMGDQVYADATYGLLDPSRLDDRYRMPYEDMRDRDNGPFGELPQEFLPRVRMTLDDHEIADNWEPWAPQVESPRFEKGLAAFFQHQRRCAPDAARTVHLREDARARGWHLFMADTRTRRDYRGEDTLHTASLLGEAQAAELEAWLDGVPRADLKIVTSAAMLLPRSREYLDDPLYLDNWQGYPASFHRLLGFLCEREVENVVFLSGDAHLACDARVTVRDLASGRQSAFHSYHAPALYAPYPFANESRWNLLLRDVFRFRTVHGDKEHWYECTVSAEVIDEGHDGCGLLTATRSGGSWSTSVEVLRAHPHSAGEAP